MTSLAWWPPVVGPLTCCWCPHYGVTRGVAGSYLASSDPALEVPLYRFCLSPLVEATASPPSIRRRKQSPTPHGRTLGTCIKTATQPFSWLPPDNSPQRTSGCPPLQLREGPRSIRPEPRPSQNPQDALSGVVLRCTYCAIRVSKHFERCF